MAYINGRKILTCICNGKVISIAFNVGEGEVEGDGGGSASFSRLSDIGMYSLFELTGKTLGVFK